MIKPWKGPFRSVIQRHLDLRHSLGFILQHQELTLRAFDQYTRRNFSKVTTITRDMVVGFLHTRQHLQLSSRHDELCSLRQFCRFFFNKILVTTSRKEVFFHLPVPPFTHTFIPLPR